MNKEIKLYNALFPLWMLMMFPQMWLFVLPGNFIIDSIVLLIVMKIFGLFAIKRYFIKNIFKIFGIGMLADIIGAGFMLLMMIVLQVGRMGDELYITFPALVLSGVLIYVFNYFMTFKNLDKKQRIKAAMIFAVATAPYTFLFPSSLLYNY